MFYYIVLLFFNIVITKIVTFVTLVEKFSNTLFIRGLHQRVEIGLYGILKIFIGAEVLSYLTCLQFWKKLKVTQCQVWVVCQVIKHLYLKLLKKQSCVVLNQNNSGRQHASFFVLNDSLQLTLHSHLVGESIMSAALRVLQLSFN